MLNVSEFIIQSLETHLFFARIMKEHALFLEAGFTPRDQSYKQQAEVLRSVFDKFLSEIISLSSGRISQEVIKSGELVTKYTLNAELATSYLTGIPIQTQLTQAEAELHPGVPVQANNILEQRISTLNQNSIELIAALIQFKTNVLSEVLACRMFTTIYPLMIDHIIDEAKEYLRHIQRLQNREPAHMVREAPEKEVLWNGIMAEHAEFIRGLLDPSEDLLIKTADNFSKEFGELTRDAKRALDKRIQLSRVTNASLRGTRKLRDFKAQGTEGILECRIKSIINPLLSDHVLREANHYIRMLTMYSK